LEEEIKSAWKYVPGETPKRVDTLQATKERKSEKDAEKTLLEGAKKAAKAAGQSILRNTGKTEAMRDEGGRPVYEDTWVGKVWDELVNHK